MNAALALAPAPAPEFAPTYDLLAFVPVEPELAGPPPAGTFVDGLVEALASTFALDADERALATLLLFGRSIGAAARQLGLDAREGQRRCRALLARAGADGRQQLFELALRLAAARELAKHLLGRQRTSTGRSSS